jgi:hypothetical protein
VVIPRLRHISRGAKTPKFSRGSIRDLFRKTALQSRGLITGNGEVIVPAILQSSDTATRVKTNIGGVDIMMAFDPIINLIARDAGSWAGVPEQIDFSCLYRRGRSGERGHETH